MVMQVYWRRWGDLNHLGRFHATPIEDDFQYCEILLNTIFSGTGVFKHFFPVSARSNERGLIAGVDNGTFAQKSANLKLTQILHRSTFQRPDAPTAKARTAESTHNTR
jgi:hypothetical protein